jgi:hypothetical protein
MKTVLAILLTILLFFCSMLAISVYDSKQQQNDLFMKIDSIEQVNTKFVIQNDSLQLAVFDLMQQSDSVRNIADSLKTVLQRNKKGRVKTDLTNTTIQEDYNYIQSILQQ